MALCLTGLLTIGIQSCKKETLSNSEKEKSGDIEKGALDRKDKDMEIEYQYFFDGKPVQEDEIDEDAQNLWTLIIAKPQPNSNKGIVKVMTFTSKEA